MTGSTTSAAISLAVLGEHAVQLAEVVVGDDVDGAGLDVERAPAASGASAGPISSSPGFTETWRPS